MSNSVCVCADYKPPGLRWHKFRLWLHDLLTSYRLTPRAYKRLVKSMKQDSDFAHSWYCNIVMPLYDNGIPIDKARALGDVLMKHLFSLTPEECQPHYEKKNQSRTHNSAQAE